MEDRPTPNYPRDTLLAHLLHKYPHLVYRYHEHDSLLENKNEQDLSEEEKADAWKQYEDDVKRKNESNMGPYGNNFGMIPNYSGLGPYANSLYSNYNNLSSVSGLNYPYNLYSQYPYANDYNQMRFNDYSAFYNKLMSPSLNFNPSTSPNLLSPPHPTPVSSPSSLMNSFNSARNWMQSAASSSSSYGNSLLSSLAQSSTTNSNFNAYLNNLYNTLGSGNTNNLSSLLPSTTASTSADPSLQLRDIASLSAYLQQHQQQLSNMASTSGTTSSSNGGSSSSTTNPTMSSSAQGPNAMRNPMLTKELLIPNRNLNLDKFNIVTTSIQTSVITKPTTSTSTVSSPSPVTVTTVNSGSTSTATVQSDTNKKSSEASVSSSNDRHNDKSIDLSKSTSDLIIKDVVSMNSFVRKSPDTTATKKLTDGSTVSSTMSEKNKSSPKPTTSTNMGIVYPASKSTNKPTANPNQISITTKVVPAAQSSAQSKSSRIACAAITNS